MTENHPKDYKLYMLTERQQTKMTTMTNTQKESKIKEKGDTKEKNEIKLNKVLWFRQTKGPALHC